MKAFEWANPTSVDQAVKLLGSPGGDAADLPRPIGGGQDLHTTMKAYITTPSRVVNLKTINGLGGITQGADGLSIGALVTLTQLATDPTVVKSYPGLAQAAHSIATPQIRNLGTVGGNLCQKPRCWYYRLENVKCLKKGGSTCYAESGENKYHAILGGGPSYIVHPSDLAPILTALGAVVIVSGGKSIPIESFFTLPSQGTIRNENVLTADQVITEIKIPATPRAGRSTYLKFKERESLDFAMSSVAAAVEFDGGTVKSARVVLGGVAPIPWRLEKVDAFLAGKKLDDATVAQAAVMATDGAKPLAKNGYKIPLTQTLVRRALMSLNA